MALPFPFSAIVGQEEMTLAIQIVAVDPSVGGVLALGDRGTGKSTAVRALADLLPPIQVVEGCAYGCDPKDKSARCEACASLKGGKKIKAITRPVPVVDLPLGATEDRVVGALDLEKALSQGIKSFSPGLLAASGENLVERDGLSVRHPARFVLVGSGNPEEGELRPQLLDRFGLSVEVRTPQDLDLRVLVVKRRDAFERDPQAFRDQWEAANAALRERILRARELLGRSKVSDAMLRLCAQLCQQLGTDGLRAELTLLRASRAYAALNKQTTVKPEHLRAVAPLALRHRLRRNPLDDTGSGARVQKALAEVLGA